MRFLVLILRVLSYGYHTLLGLFLLGIGVVGKMSPSTSFYTPALPGEAESQPIWAIGLGLIALLTVALSALKDFRPPFVLWTLAAVVLMYRGFFWGDYTYADVDEFKTVLYLFGGSVLAFIGAALSTGDKR